jgi:hypothetical protein
LGNPYRVYEQANMFHRHSAGAFGDYNLERALEPDASVPTGVRARIRSDLAARMFHRNGLEDGHSAMFDNAYAPLDATAACRSTRHCK